MIEKQFHLVATELEWSERPNADRDPLEHEDKWGKVNSPSYSLYAPLSGLSLSCAKDEPFLRGSQFCLELWMKLETELGDDFILAVLQIGEHSLTLMRENNSCALVFSGPGAHEVKPI